MLSLLGVGVLLAAVVVPGLLGMTMMMGLLYTPCGDQKTTPGEYGYVWEDVSFPAASGASIRAYFIPGTTGAAVIIPPAMGGGRGNRLEEADVFARHGYAVLAFESRRCAGMGPLSLGYKEAGDIGDALAYLQSRDDVNSDRIAVFGFSSAGAAAVMAAARYPDLQAVIAEGGYSEFARTVVGLDELGGPVVAAIYKGAMGLTYRAVTGVSIHRLSPLDAIAVITPRPILLIYGTEERSLADGIEQYNAAGENATLWVVEGAGHGDYVRVAPAGFEWRVITFLDQALVGKGVATDD